MIVAIDIGYGYTKTCLSPNGSKSDYLDGMFPTAVSKYIPDADGFGEAPVVVTVNGVRFSVGDSAAREGKTINTRTKDFVGSAAYLAILGYAIEKSVYKSKVLVLGLPPAQFTEDFTESLTKKIRVAEIIGTSGQAVVIPPVIKWVPQGAGIFFAHVRNGGSDDFLKNVVVLDNGYYTLDKLFFIKGRLVKSLAISEPLGVSEVYERIKDRFLKEHKIFLKSDDSCDKLIKEGKITLTGFEYCLDVKGIVDLYSSRLIASIEEYIHNLSAEAEVIIGGGGGIELIDDTQLEKFNIKKCSRSQMLNAQGYYAYGEYFV